MRSAYPTSSSAASVSRTLRPLRCSNGWPMSCSSLASRWETADVVTCSMFAAELIEPVRATDCKALSWARSSCPPRRYDRPLLTWPPYHVDLTPPDRRITALDQAFGRYRFGADRRRWWPGTASIASASPTYREGER